MKLNHTNIFSIGFRGEGKSFLNRPLYRLEIPKSPKGYWYHYELQLELGDYPESNPNSGILSLYDKGTKDAHMITSEKVNKENKYKKIDFILDTDNTHVTGIKFMNLEERIIPIAWHVTTLERLNKIYTALTGNPPLQIRKPK